MQQTCGDLAVQAARETDKFGASCGGAKGQHERGTLGLGSQAHRALMDQGLVAWGSPWGILQGSSEGLGLILAPRGAGVCGSWGCALGGGGGAAPPTHQRLQLSHSKACPKPSCMAV